MENAIWFGRLYFFIGRLGQRSQWRVAFPLGQVVIRLGVWWINFGAAPKSVEVKWWQQQQRIQRLEQEIYELRGAGKNVIYLE